MPDAHTLWIFAVACAGLALLPGPAMLYIVTRGVVHGRRGGLVSMLGVEAGDFVQVLAATAGLAAIVASSAAAFTIVKYAGAAYLVFLGVRALREARRGRQEEVERPGPSSGRLFWEGFLVGALNPKLALFLLAFLPQFVDPAGGPVWLQTLVLGIVLQTVIMAGDTCFALAAGSAGNRIRSWIQGRRIAVASGTVYIGLGISAALGDAQRK